MLLKPSNITHKRKKNIRAWFRHRFRNNQTTRHGILVPRNFFLNDDITIGGLMSTNRNYSGSQTNPTQKKHRITVVHTTTALCKYTIVTHRPSRPRFKRRLKTN